MYTAHVPAPELDLRDDTPVSAAFGDVYFSRGGGVAETEHVFLRGNGLPQRWQNKTAPKDCVGNAGGGSPLQSDKACVAAGEPLAEGVSAKRVGGDAPFHQNFTIGELGFGSGLNFLVAWKRFVETADAGAVLHYCAIEKFPFTRAQLQQVLALQPELAEQAAALLASYPLRLPGVHRIHLPRAVLTLYFGDVAEMLAEWEPCVGNAGGVREVISDQSRESSKKEVVSHRVAEGEPQSGGGKLRSSEGGASPPQRDRACVGSAEPEGRGSAQSAKGVMPPSNNNFINAWFLDGFSPAKNPAMWTPEVLAAIYRLSAPGATLATFTSAGAVRRGLIEAGFMMEKQAGFGHKREMLVGVKALPVAPAIVHNDAVSQTIPITIIGAGIAGATLARALAERGYRVKVLERGEVASGASGNAAGVLFPQLSKHWNRSTQWYFTAYGFALRQLQHWRAQGLDFASAAPGMLRLPRHEEEELQLRAMNAHWGLDPEMVHWVEREEATARAAVNLATGGAWFPHGTWVNPGQLCAALLQHDAIELRTHAAVKSVTRAPQGWHVTLASGEVIATQQCCITAAQESAEFLAPYGIRLHQVGGQVSELAAENVAAPLRSILCLKGYVIPLAERYLIGATYHREGMLEVTAARHQENLAELAAILPDWHLGEAVGGRSAIRATTPDRLPYIGAVEDGLYVSTGHGSRGLLSAPLAAEILASSMAGECAPVSRSLLAAVHPLRFQGRRG